MKRLFLVCVLFGALSVSLDALSQPSSVSIYNISIPLINGSDVLNLSSWQGKKILIVNTASQSIYSNQFALLEQLNQKFKDSGLVILACPSNSIGFEPYSNQQIQTFCNNNNYSITYIQGTKISITGNSIHPLYEWLTQKAMNGVNNVMIRNDFSKFLINGQGQLVGFFDGSINPLDEKVLQAIRNN